MSKLVAVTCAVALALAVPGCGSSGSDGSSTKRTTTTASSNGTTDPKALPTTTAPDLSDVSEEDYVEAFAANFSSGDRKSGQLVVTKKQAACVAPKFVSVITVKRLKAKGATPEAVAAPGFDGSSLDLDQEQGEALVESFEQCKVDIVTLLVDSMTVGLTDEQRSCAREKVDQDKARTFLVATFGSGDAEAEFESMINELTTACDLPTS